MVRPIIWRDCETFWIENGITLRLRISKFQNIAKHANFLACFLYIYDIIHYGGKLMAKVNINSKKRMFTVLTFLLVLLVALIGRMFFWQVVKAEELQQKALSKLPTEFVCILNTAYDRMLKK